MSDDWERLWRFEGANVQGLHWGLAAAHDTPQLDPQRLAGIEHPHGAYMV